jgi:hypothetical protein
MKLVTVSRVFSPAEAQLLRSRLEAAEIPAVVTHETAALMIEGYSMAAGGVLVQVADDRAAEARELLGLPPLPPGLDEARPAPAEDPPADAFVTVFRGFSPAEGDLVRSQLAAAGIEAVLTHETAPLASLMASGGVFVQVAKERAEEARQLIAAPKPDEPKV